MIKNGKLILEPNLGNIEDLIDYFSLGCKTMIFNVLGIKSALKFIKIQNKIILKVTMDKILHFIIFY